MTTYYAAPDAAKIAERLIAEHHTHRVDQRVEFVFREKAAKTNGKVVLGKARKLSGLNAFLARRTEDGEDTLGAEFFVIELAGDEWDRMSKAQRRALVDHELCFPAGTLVTGPAAVGSSTRWYAGQLVEVRTAAGHFLSATPNHPVLTDRGWVPMGFLHEGDHVVSCVDPERVAAAMDPHEHQVPARIEQVARAVDVRLGVVPEASEDLYADVADGDVDVVAADGLLLDQRQPTTTEKVRHFLFGRRHRVDVRLARRRHLGERLLAMALPSPRLTHRTSHGLALLERHLGGAVVLGSRSATDLDARFDEQALQGGPADAEVLWERVQGLAGGVALDEVVEINVRSFRGHVYNLQTSQGWYIANGVVVHNCHLTIEYDEEDETFKLGLRAHDVEEFTAIVERHGLWKDDLAEFAKAAKEQLDLFGEGAQPGSVEEAVADFVDATFADGGVDSVTVSAGDQSVTIDKDTAKHLRAVH